MIFAIHIIIFLIIHKKSHCFYLLLFTIQNVFDIVYLYESIFLCKNYYKLEEDTW